MSFFGCAAHGRHDCFLCSMQASARETAHAAQAQARTAEQHLRAVKDHRRADQRRVARNDALTALLGAYTQRGIAKIEAQTALDVAAAQAGEEQRRIADQRAYEEQQRREVEGERQERLRFRHSALAAAAESGRALSELDIECAYLAWREQVRQQREAEVGILRAQFEAHRQGLLGQAAAEYATLDQEQAELDVSRHLLMSRRWLRVAIPLAVLTLGILEVTGFAGFVLAGAITGVYVWRRLQRAQEVVPHMVATGQQKALAASAGVPVLLTAAAGTCFFTVHSGFDNDALSNWFWGLVGLGAGIWALRARSRYRGMEHEQAGLSARRVEANGRQKQAGAMNFESMLAAGAFDPAAPTGSEHAGGRPSR